MKKVVTGNHAVSYGVKLARAQVIAAYPITPQTQVVELLSEFCASGKLNAKFIKVESEHSAMAACIAASASGARAFTATSAHGLALMHEMLHWAVGARTPVVMANINRAMGPGWSVWTDQNDSLAQRDVGWIQIYCESNQEVLDTTIQAFKIAERVLLPVMLILDAFVLSHTSEPVDIPDQEQVDEFLPPYNLKTKLDVNNPRAYGGLTNPDHYFELRYKIQKAHTEALAVIKEIDEEYKKHFGRQYGLVEPYRCDDAKVILVTSGTITSTARLVIDEMRDEGRKVGLLKYRVFRPTPREILRDILYRAQKVCVIDRNISFGHGGIFAQEIKSVLYGLPASPPVYSFIIGLGGRDVTPKDIREIIEYTYKEETPAEPVIYRGVRL
ncbi:MAG: pyruvate ferredoxin oxidoreductase [candidate division WOR-3 bacterium]|nr:pyruvate ferredoxin oxidoreductase [candidate division WOR-3 bacterium]MCX7757572.1 pyruvate ferredoxin oxidoreductase [candidate division WOR-3 bacterium]MDW7987536.1 pyruvate ferredoxin oxidoreductase [candidate division WOR-3 bacterium]